MRWNPHEYIWMLKSVYGSNPMKISKLDKQVNT